ncbi:hypothetical protein [Mesorhizobium sp. ES1-1]|uniref:hypothetical protein n=1 Tax=Mesorhizobium sp. ES1-1 TaxID=2876629 RepID=UPI001CCAB423|nr:hypothetical protein [Mesorhizobium sp. ES1-1]MBZ9678930.1 hypothetical protein [Mesorhizobium sp. ES1-1]
MTDVENLRFNVLRNALYHTSRRRAAERWSRFCNFLVILLGAAAMGDVMRRFGFDGIWLGAAVSTVAAAQLVFDFGRQARDHQSLQRDYYNLLAEIEECLEPGDVECANWAGKMTRIAGDEPPVLRAVDAKAYNDALDALDSYNHGQHLYIPLYQRLTASFFSYDGYNYKKFAELNQTQNT